MRYLYARFEGYIGFYTGLGLTKLEIDFTKCKHNIVLISGMNGCGKSTLMNALSVFPDDSSSFVEFLDGKKILRLTTGEDIYDINITSLSDGKGGRKGTKAFIQKNGVELNENGNVTSYKDIIFSEFELDSNYISLSRLSSIDRGLGDKKPAERKKFASSIIDNMEVYNNMYKTLNKKSLVLKSTINNLHTKIQNIGSKENLELTLGKMKEQHDRLQSEITKINNEIISIQAKNSIDENEAKEIETISNQFNEENKAVESILSNIEVFIHKTKIKIDNIEIRYNKDKELYNFYNSKVESISTNWRTGNERLESLSRNILELDATISNYESQGKNLIKSQYTESNKKINDMKKELKALGVEADINLIEPIKSLLSFYQSFITKLDRFYDGLNTDDVNIILKWNNNIEKAKEELSHMINQLEITREKISNLSSDIKIISVLDDRPKNCKIDSCPFISSAIELKKQYKNIKLDNQLSSLLETEMDFSNGITKQNEYIDHLNLLNSKRMILDDIRDLILENKHLEPIFKDNIFYDFDKQLSNISQFNNQRDPRKYIDALGILQMYSLEVQSNKELEIKYEAYRDQVQIMNNNKSLLNNMKSERETLLSEIQDYKRDIDKYSSLRETINSNLGIESEYYNEYLRYKDKKESIDKLSIKMEEFSKKSSKAIESVEVISKFTEKMNDIRSEDNPLIDSISRLEGQLILLNSYYEEYNKYIDEFNMIETIKKYCSPTGGGIQTIFIQLYMRKTLEISNQILAMLFNGQYQLIDFVINEKEFKIPFVGPSGLPADDISSGSMSQIEMMGMVINLALLYQASTKFNIAYLDEIGSGLDNHNQGEFIKVIYYISKYLNMEQVFMICHSLAVDESGVDIIKLKDYEEFENNSTGNIIYNYKEDSNEDTVY